MATTSSPREAVVLIGAGTQGRRLAYMWSSQGKPVYVVDPQERQLQAVMPYVQHLRATSENPAQTWGPITTAAPTSLRTILEEAWLVVECVPENLELKRKVLAELDATAPSDTIIASNSSSYGVSEIIEGLDLQHNARIVSAHCYWPPETTAIEIMGHAETNAALIPILLQQCELHGFTPFHVKRDSIGYLYNRIWAAIKRETLLLLAEGVGTPQEVDAIFKDVLKTPKGPCEQMDVVGLDVVRDIEQHYADTRPGVPMEPREYLSQLIDSGCLGVKNGHGFYDYRRNDDSGMATDASDRARL